MSCWPNGASGAVSLTFDDAIPCHLSRVVPILNEFGLRGTFYVNPTARWLEAAAEWRVAQQAGHEIGNHTLLHPCSGNFSWMNPEHALETMTLEEIEADIVQARKILEAALPGQAAHSFCYPCYQDFVGRGPTRQSYAPVVAKHYAAARGRGESFNRPDRMDMHALWSLPCERKTGAEMIGHCEQAADAGGWTILTFHGVGEAHLAVEEGEFRALCAHLARHAARLWTAPLITVAQRVRHSSEEVK